MLALVTGPFPSAVQAFAHVEEIRDYNQLQDAHVRFTDFSGVEGTALPAVEQLRRQDGSRNKLESPPHTHPHKPPTPPPPPQHPAGATRRPPDTLEGVIGIGERARAAAPRVRRRAASARCCRLSPSTRPDCRRPGPPRWYTSSAAAATPSAMRLIWTPCITRGSRRYRPQGPTPTQSSLWTTAMVSSHRLREPVTFGADIMAGSFIKNPGGGITPRPALTAGRRDLVEKCSHRFRARHRRRLGCTQDSLGIQLPRLLLRAGRRLRAESHLCPVSAGAGGCQSRAALPPTTTTFVTCFDSGSAARTDGLLRASSTTALWTALPAPKPADEPGYTD